MRRFDDFYKFIVSTALIPVLSFEIAAASTPISIDALATIPSNNPSVLNLYCQDISGNYFQSRIALINSSDTKSDYAISTAHGLMSNNNDFMHCHVKSFGDSYEISDAFIANDYKAGSATDWAIIKLPRITNTKITRFKLPEFSLPSQSIFKQQANLVTFPKARGLGHNSQTCLSLPGAYVGIKESNILAHDCRVIGGQSGSPLALSHNGDDILIGIHLGQSFILQSPITKRPERMGYFRFFDREMVETIDQTVGNFNP